MGRAGRPAAARAPARLRRHRRGRAARRGAALAAAGRRGRRSERGARRRRRPRRDGALGRARRAATGGAPWPMRSAATWRARPARTCRAPRPCCASWPRRTRIRSSPGACSARPCWPPRRSRSERPPPGDAGATRLLILALACQASISIVQWGLGVIAPDLQQRYDLSAASLGALVNATAFGNAVALIAAGVDRRSLGPAQAAARTRAPRAGCCWSRARSLTNPVGLGIALFASGVAGAVVAVGATVSVFHGFPPERRGFALGMRQMSVALGGLLAALLLPLAVHLGGVGLALGVSGVLTAVTAIVFALDTPHGPLVPPDARAARRRAVRGAARARHGHACCSSRVCYIVALDAVLTFVGARAARRRREPRRRQPAVRVRQHQRDGRARSPGDVSPMPAAGGGASRRCATSASSACARRAADLGRLARGHGRPDRARSSCSASARSASTACST